MHVVLVSQLFQELCSFGFDWSQDSELKTQTMPILDMVQRRVISLEVLQHVYTNHAPYLQHNCEKVIL